MCRVHPKPPKVSLSTTLHGPAYTGEKLPIYIALENGEQETVTLGIQFDFPDIEGEKGIVLKHINTNLRTNLFVAKFFRDFIRKQHTQCRKAAPWRTT